jgi:hypothetical protein
MEAATHRAYQRHLAGAQAAVMSMGETVHATLRAFASTGSATKEASQPGIDVRLGLCCVRRFSKKMWRGCRDWPGGSVPGPDAVTVAAQHQGDPAWRSTCF